MKGSFAYWTGDRPSRPAHWGIAGPGISAEWTQGGESEWNSMGAAADGDEGRVPPRLRRPAGRQVPRLGPLRRSPQEDRAVHASTIQQGGKTVARAASWASSRSCRPTTSTSSTGASRSAGARSTATCRRARRGSTLVIDKAGEAWRQVDAVLITDDLNTCPSAARSRRSPTSSAFDLQPKDGAALARHGKDLPAGRAGSGRSSAAATSPCGPASTPTPSGGRKQDSTTLTLYDLFFQFAPPADIRDKFHKQFAGRKDLPIMSWPRPAAGLLPGQHAGPVAGHAAAASGWRRTKTPFYIMTNYASRQLHRQDRPRHLRRR